MVTALVNLFTNLLAAINVIVGYFHDKREQQAGADAAAKAGIDETQQFTKDAKRGADSVDPAYDKRVHNRFRRE